MTLDDIVALSLLGDLSRRHLIARLRANDPELLDRVRGQRERAAQARHHAEAVGIHVIPWNDVRFPAALLAIPDAPPALWYRGALTALEAPAVAIVGSRAASSVALEAAALLGRGLAARGVTVVSGLARGVDSAAHRGALETGRTIAVLGSGPDRVYPSEHVALADAVSRLGMVVSEYPPGTPPLTFHFPQRNRLISGMSRGVVVIEASEKSGSLITAACALQQGREVMAVPGNVLSGRNRGGHALIRDGARIVETVEDILDELGIVASESPASGTASSDKIATCQDPVLRAMEAGQAYDLEGLAENSGMAVARLLPLVSELELTGRIRRVAGGRFVRTS